MIISVGIELMPFSGISYISVISTAFCHKETSFLEHKILE